MANGPIHIDLASLADGEARQPAWAFAGEELNANLLVFEAGQGVASHVNQEVEVLLVGIAGTGTVTIDDARYVLAAGQVVVVPKGARRRTEAGAGRFAYLTCHRRRGSLWPRPHTRPGQALAEAGDIGSQPAE